MSDVPHGWVKIAGSSFWRTLLGGSTSSVTRRSVGAFIGFYGLVYAPLIWQPEDWILAALIWFYSLVFVVLGIVTVTARLRNPSPEANFDTDQLRLGKRTIPFSAIAEAAYWRVSRRRRIDSQLIFGAHIMPTVTVMLRSSKRRELTQDERELVAEILRRSPIEIPEQKPDPYDPTGKFAWMDHPNSLTRDEAIDYVLHTPESGEPVRTPPRPRSIWIDED